MKDLKETILQDINEIATGKDPIIGKPKTKYLDTVQTVKPDDISGILGEIPNENPISHEVIGTNKEGNVDVRFSMPNGKASRKSGKEAVDTGFSKRVSFLDKHFKSTPNREDALISLANDVKAGGNKPITLPAGLETTPTDITKVKQKAFVASGRTAGANELRTIGAKALDSKLDTLVGNYNTSLPKEGNPESPYFKGVKKRLQTVAGRFGNVASGLKALVSDPDSFVTAKGGINDKASDPAKAERTKGTKETEAENDFASLMKNAGASFAKKKAAVSPAVEKFTAKAVAERLGRREAGTLLSDGRQARRLTPEEHGERAYAVEKQRLAGIAKARAERDKAKGVITLDTELDKHTAALKAAEEAAKGEKK